MQRCETCGSEFADELEQCPHCAEAASEGGGEVFRCSQCAEDFRDSDACPACGTLRESAACETHPDRDAAGRCVVCGRAVCEECRARDRGATLCEEHASVMVIEGWAQVYSNANEFEAQLVRENLRAEGIDAQIYSQRDRAFSLDLGELSIVRLLVPVWEYERALRLIREHMDTEGEVVFACPSCGEAFDPGTRECSSCGAALV
jgi:hypothetical protein